MTDIERLRTEREEVLRQARTLVESADDHELQGEERGNLDRLLKRAADLLDEIRSKETDAVQE